MACVKTEDGGFVLLGYGRALITYVCIGNLKIRSTIVNPPLHLQREASKQQRHALSAIRAYPSVVALTES